jgi:hypothetical protein
MSLLLYLYRAEDFRRPRFEPRAAGYPHLVVEARQVIAAVVTRAIHDGYVARVDVSAPSGEDDPWPRWCSTEGQFAAVIQGFGIAAAREPDEFMKAYPINVWLVPAASSRAESLVELFRRLTFDEPVMDDMLSAGVVRLSISDAYCDVLAGEPQAQRALGWLRSARTELPSMISWNVDESPED